MHSRQFYDGVTQTLLAAPLFWNIQLLSTIKQAESTSGSAIFLWRNFHDLMPPFHDLSMRMSRTYLFICLRPSTCCQSSTQSFHKEEEFFLDFDDWEHRSFIDRNWRLAISGDSGYSRQSGHPGEYGWSHPLQPGHLAKLGVEGYCVTGPLCMILHCA